MSFCVPQVGIMVWYCAYYVITDKVLDALTRELFVMLFYFKLNSTLTM